MSRVRVVRSRSAFCSWPRSCPVRAGCGERQRRRPAARRRARGVAVFVAVDTDSIGDAGQQAEDAARRSSRTARACCSRSRTRSLDEEGIDFEADVEPALGDEIAIVVLDAPAEDALAERTSDHASSRSPTTRPRFERFSRRATSSPSRARSTGGRSSPTPGVARQLRRGARRRTPGRSEDFERAMADLDDGALATRLRQRRSS